MKNSGYSWVADSLVNYVILYILDFMPSNYFIVEIVKVQEVPFSMEYRAWPLAYRLRYYILLS